MKVKVIFLKDYKFRISYFVGDIAEAFVRDGGYMIDHVWLGYNTCISLSEYRERQINDILYDDIEG